MRPTTLCFPKRDKLFLLGCKKRGFGAGYYNGFGGKIEDGESFRACAVREVFEEVSLLVKEEDLQAVGLLDFQFPYSPELSHISYVYIVEQFQGIPLESEEMEPHWFTLEETPFDHMWAGDEQWIPRIWCGEKLKGIITFKEDNSTIESMQFVTVEEVLESDDVDRVTAWIYEGMK